MNLDRIDVATDGSGADAHRLYRPGWRHPLERFDLALGLPSSSSHALFGGLIGSAIVAIGFDGVQWMGVLSKIIVPAVLSPSSRLSWQQPVPGWFTVSLLRWLMTVSTVVSVRDRLRPPPLMSLAHGTNDAEDHGRDFPGSGCFGHPEQ